VTPRRIEILGVPVDCVTMAEAVNFVDDRVASGLECSTVIAVNPEKIMRARHDSSLAANLECTSLLIPDGIGAVWAARLLWNAAIERVPGSELMPALCARSAEKGYGVFLFGAKEEVNARAAAVLPECYPGLHIAGRHHGYVDADAMPDMIDRINRSGADILFVALGSPRQEAWMHEHAQNLKVKVAQGVGGTFDVISGRVNRAPPLFLTLHLEWFYRLLREPRRLWRQRSLVAFVACVAARMIRLVK
jgi:N-acetylglucosaminyldiphosphoundecaprenol N-acetyl-beta-D-mannosaminyltransferase